MNWKLSGMKKFLPKLRCYHDIGLKRLTKSMKDLSQDNQSPNQDLKPDLPNNSRNANHLTASLV
jgi:hypothetical protein